MSGSSSPAGKPDKTMSTNLLTMKFMQRAAASKEAASKEAASKVIPAPSEDSKGRKSKRPRLSTEAESPRNSDMDAIAAALAAEEEKRQQAVARAAAEAGETHWVLDVPAAPQRSSQPVVVAADSLDADDDDYSGGRQAFGNFKRKEKNPPPPPPKKDEKKYQNDDYEDDEIVNPKNAYEVAANEKQKKAAKLHKERDDEYWETKRLSGMTGLSGNNARKMGAPTPEKNKKKKRKSR
ncbi:unnamed protein product [Penicillium olsonii]|nr:unnamed protein product [Penicillium olsonii]CAG7927610.1 unnamed protein product [Penicillium olsonii]